MVNAELAFQPKPLMAMMDIVGILPAEIAFRKTQIMNGIQQVGFAHTITAADAYNPFREGELLREIVFELKE